MRRYSSTPMRTGRVVTNFQQYFQKDEPPDENSLEERSAEAFYELANAPVVGFKIESSKRGKEIRIHQDSECQTHTGGIVWETSYLLACYLEAKHKNKKNSLGKVLEVGSGCGMLGLILSASKLAKNVVMTETTEVLPNLEENVSFNLKQKGQKKRGGQQNKRGGVEPRKGKHSRQIPRVQIVRLIKVTIHQLITHYL